MVSIIIFEVFFKEKPSNNRSKFCDSYTYWSPSESKYIKHKSGFLIARKTECLKKKQVKFSMESKRQEVKNVIYADLEFHIMKVAARGKDFKKSDHKQIIRVYNCMCVYRLYVCV